MAVFREHPYGNARFEVDLGTGEPQGFSEVHLPQMFIQAVEVREGNDKEGHSRKVPARPHFGPMLLRRGFRGSLELYEWWKQTATNGVGAKRTLVVRLLDEGGSQAVAEWRLRGCWPTRYAVSPLNATGNEVAMEEMELACEGLEME